MAHWTCSGSGKVGDTLYVHSSLRSDGAYVECNLIPIDIEFWARVLRKRNYLRHDEFNQDRNLKAGVLFPGVIAWAQDANPMGKEPA